MRRSEIHLVDLNSISGAEASKRRPAMIVSKNGANTTAARLGQGFVAVVPVTTNTARVYLVQLLPADTGLERDSKARAEQVRVVAIEPLGGPIGVVRWL